MANRLIHETSPYLLQHAENPVDWYSWGEDAFKKAKTEDKPIFLSIGYAACHWCHVMAHESFEDPEIANLLNQNFVPIKVDREERPDLDSIYMNAVVAMTGQGGWPMSLFLTPDGHPFFGGTYFPPHPRYGMPSFRQVLESVIKSWLEEREQLGEVSNEVADHIRKGMEISPAQNPISEKTLDQAATRLISTYDKVHGGWGGAPKFPQAMAIDFLFQIATRGNQSALEKGLHALRSMAQGGMYDVLGGGFHRYSTDEDWLVPHFEKMLYDNALLARSYLHAYQLTGDPFFKQICTQTLDFIYRDMTGKDGGFFSSLDADVDGEEGKCYIWDPQTISRILEDTQLVRLFSEAYGINEAGNFHGNCILRRVKGDETLAEQFGIDKAEVEKHLEIARARLFEYRRNQAQPGVDDKVLVAWNALAQWAFAEAGVALDRPEYIQIATRNAGMLIQKLNRQGRLLRSYRAGIAQHTAYLEDYAALILALLATYQADPNVRWYQTAVQLLGEMLQSYLGDPGEWFDTRSGENIPIIRPRETQDNAIPSGGALASLALQKMAAYSGENNLQEKATAMLGRVQDLARQYPTAFGFWLQSLDFAVGPVKEVAILGKSKDSNRKSLVTVTFSQYLPRKVVAISKLPISPGSPELLSDRTLLNNQPTAYVCEHFTCQLPVNDPAGLQQQLNKAQQATA